MFGKFGVLYVFWCVFVQFVLVCFLDLELGSRAGCGKIREFKGKCGKLREKMGK
jgi:hypothetical protein